MVRAISCKKSLNEKIREFLVNSCILILLLCLLMLLLILCNKYTVSQYESEIAKNNKLISNYKVLTEKYKAESANIHKEAEVARLKAFIDYYGGEQ